jgi:hypothetical protein
MSSQSTPKTAGRVSAPPVRKRGPGRWILFAAILGATALWLHRGWNRPEAELPIPGTRLSAAPRTVEPVDACAFYNASGELEAELLKGFDPATAIQINQTALNGWGYAALVRTPAPQSGRLAAFENAAPLGFSRSDIGAEIEIPVRDLPDGQAELRGVLAPVGLKFRQKIRPDANGNLRIPVPAGVLSPADYTLTLCLEAGGEREFAILPIVIGPYLRPDRFLTYAWNAGGTSEADLEQQIRWARLLGIQVLDTPILPAVAALRNGLFVSAHLVTLYQGEVGESYAGTPERRKFAEDQAEALGDMARRYRHISWCIPNSEYGSATFPADPAFGSAMRAAIGLHPATLRLDRPGDSPRLTRDVAALSPGVFPHDLPELLAFRHARREGRGWFGLNRLTREVARRKAPWLTFWADPVFTMEQFEAFDAVGFWQYENNLYETMAQTRKADCARRMNGAREVFLTLSQWYSGITNANHTPGDETSGYGMKSPDQHRAESWLTLTLPAQALGYWAIDQMEKDAECAEGLRRALDEVIQPYGMMLKPTSHVPVPVAFYVSSDGEFLARCDRPYGEWFSHHYQWGVRPALFELFKGRIDWIDDADVLAGRLQNYKLVLCPILAATTDRVLDRLKEYQEGGGVLAGDEYWGVASLAPKETFPGRSPEVRGIPFANANLAAWHAKNREEILTWRPKNIPEDRELFEIDTPSPDVMPALRELDGVRYAVAANLRFRKGDFSKRRGYDKATFLDEGVEQETELWIKAPPDTVVYDAIASRQVDPASILRVGDRIRLDVTLPGGGGALFVLHPRPIASVTAAVGANGPVKSGTILFLDLAVRNDQGLPIPGQTVVHLTVRDNKGRIQDVSGYHPVRSGQARIAVGVPIDAQGGIWSVEVRDLTSGLEGRASLTVVESPQFSEPAPAAAPPAGGATAPDRSLINSKRPADAS